jgi:uncharacterized membrane protein YoaK (UPF0700 family)
LVKHYGWRVRLLAAALSAAAGYVDAVGFLMTGGLFVSFMSGNSTRMAVGLAGGASNAGLAAGLILAFVLGAAAGSFIGRVAKANRALTILTFVALLLALAALLSRWGLGLLAFLPIALAMGAENTVFAEEGEVRIGLTYMTGTLVKLGKHITAALMGGPPLDWLPYLLLWFGLVCGAVLGANIYAHVGAAALWGGAGAMAVLAVIASRLRLDLEPRAEAGV